MSDKGGGALQMSNLQLPERNLPIMAVKSQTHGSDFRRMHAHCAAAVFSLALLVP